LFAIEVKKKMTKGSGGREIPGALLVKKRKTGFCFTVSRLRLRPFEQVEADMMQAMRSRKAVSK
jgi:hypothetical protein